MLRSGLHFGRFTVFAMLRTENTEDGIGWQRWKKPKFPFHLFPFYVHIINVIIYLFWSSLFLLSRLSLRLYFSLTALPAVSISNYNIHFYHLLYSWTSKIFNSFYSIDIYITLQPGHILNPRNTKHIPRLDCEFVPTPLS